MALQAAFARQESLAAERAQDEAECQLKFMRDLSGGQYVDVQVGGTNRCTGCVKRVDTSGVVIHFVGFDREYDKGTVRDTAY